MDDGVQNTAHHIIHSFTEGEFHFTLLNAYVTVGTNITRATVL